MADTYLQYGCGLCAPEGWLNFDASPSLRLRKIPVLGGLFKRYTPPFPANVLYGDIVRGLPVPPASCRAVYCSHVLEHLALEDCRTALRNTYQYLGPKGVFRFVLPDLQVLARQYIESDDHDAALKFIMYTGLGRINRPRSLYAFLTEWLGNRRHLWLWDLKSISHELEEVGFTHIRPASFGDSTEAPFEQVEDVDRWKNCLGVECVRPAR